MKEERKSIGAQGLEKREGSKDHTELRHAAAHILAEVDALGLLGIYDEGVIIADAVGRIVFYNEAQAKIDDLPVDFVLGRHVNEIYTLDRESSLIMRCLDRREPIYGHLFFYRTRRGKVANTICSAYPLMHGDTLAGCICIVKNYNLLERTITGASLIPSDQRPSLGNGTRFQFTDIVGSDEAFLRGLKIARLATDSPSPIMLYGETGTGKEIFAQSIHNYSARGARPFVAINCAAIPETLLEGLLFGTTRGAFTGAVTRQGIFEQAHGGTLFLDELNAMPINLQAKLLRVLQERRLRRVGGSEDIAIDFKILSSVNEAPHAAIKAGRLRTDLYYRLGVVFIAIPPLRERPADIDLLTHHFIHLQNRKLNKLVHGISSEVMDLFRRYHWPGNVRELEHIVEGTMNVLGGEDRIERRHLPMHFFHPDFGALTHEGRAVALPKTPLKAGSPAAAPVDVPTRPDIPSQGDLLARQQRRECELIKEHLAAAGGNAAEAARQLGISRQLLHYKLKKYCLRG
jgi:arginine utilization regulatory protein